MYEVLNDEEVEGLEEAWREMMELMAADIKP